MEADIFLNPSLKIKNLTMDGRIRVQSSQRRSRISVKKSFSECSLPAVKSLLQSQKELCTVSAEEMKENEDNFNEVTFLGFTGETTTAPKELSAMAVELPDILKSFHLCNLNESEVFFLKDIPKPLGASDILKQKNRCSRILCVMRLSPSFPRHRVDSVFTLLSKYAAGIRCTMEMCLLQKHISDVPHTEDDDTNWSVSSIEDDFVTALEHLDEDDPTKTCSGQVTPEKCQDATSHTSLAHSLESTEPKFVISMHRKSAKPSTSLVNISECKELSSSTKSSVATSVSDPWIQRNFFKHHNSSDQSLNVFHKTLFSSSPADSSESDCSSPSPVIFLDEEGYQRSWKAKLQLPKIPVMKDGVEDSDSEVSEFFDSFDQFDEEQTHESCLKHGKDPVLSNLSQKKIISYKKSCSKTTAMNPQKFKFDRPTLPANVRKPTPRKPESPYGSLLDVPDSPRPMKTSGDDSGGLFSPIRSSAFSPLGSCFSTECLCQRSISRDTINENHNLLCRTHSDFANNISIEILGSVFNSHSSLCRCMQDVSNRIVSKEEKSHTAKGKAPGRELEKKGKSKHRSLIIKDNIQKFASELIEKSFGSAFKDLHKGFSSCTNALCHLAAKLTSSVFQMAFYEIGRRQALSLKEKAINRLAGFLVSEAITGALKELRSVKQQIFTNTVAKFAADLAEELIFEGIMEVCQFSQPSTPAASQNWFFHYNDNIVKSYARDLSESVIQEAFIELSQVDVTFTTQAAISISMDNMKYVSAENMQESMQTSSAYSDFDDKVSVVLNPIKELKKEYTIHEALFYTSGIASSIPVPFAGSILCRRHSSPNINARNHSISYGNQKTFKQSTQLCYTTKKRQDEVTSLIYLSADNSASSEFNVHFKQANNSEVGSILDSTGGQNINNFSGTMVDMIVTEAYETVTSSKVSKTAEQYKNMLKMENTPYLQCIGEDTCKNMFGNYLAKRIVRQSIEETKSACSATSEKFAYCVGLGTNQNNIKPSEKKKIVPVIVGQQQMPLNNSSKFHVTPVYLNRCLLSGFKESVEEKKHVACKASTCVSSPCSSVTFIKCVEEFPDLENSAKSLSNPQVKCNMYKATGCSGFPHEKIIDMNTPTSVMSSCDDAFQIEDKLSVRDGNLCVVPDTPPPTPLIPSQANCEWNLRKLTKKLKGQLAKEFAPATPPSTPYRSEIDEVSENDHHYLEKEEFILKLMRSLSEEVESSESEEFSEPLAERVKISVRTIEYADHLAHHIISMATEMAASHLDDKTVKLENSKYFQLSMEDKRCVYTTFMNVPEKTSNSLWVYAGDMARKVISEAKKMVKSRHCKFLRLNQVNKQADCFHHKRNYNEYWSKDRKYPLADQWSRETDSILSLPQDPGLTSKYPSCESVTDEYADHIIQILKKEGGHSELIMDQFASRVAYRSIKSGMQQAARKLKMKCNRKIVPVQTSELNSELALFELINMGADKKKQKKGNVHQFGKQPYENKCSQHKTECPKLLDFSVSLAHCITHDVRKRIKMSATCLPKSLTDSCLYKTSKVDKSAEPKMFSPFSCKQKLYHSTGSLNEYSYRDGIFHAIEQYARKVVDDTLEVSLESASLQTAENWRNRSSYAEKLSPFSATACGYCGVKEQQYYTGYSSSHLLEQDLYSEVQQIPNTRLEGIYSKTDVLHLDIPKIHIDMDENVAFAEDVAAMTFDRTERQLSNTSLAADSGIGQDGISFAESLTTEIMTSCMTNIGQTVNISSMGKERFNSAESIVSQPMSLSTGDDSTGSWSNLSFEDEHPDETSSFLHLSDSNGNSSSWSSLGLEGDMYEENLSFPTSDSDGTEDNEEELKDTIEGLGRTGKALVIINVDIGPCMMDSQLRMTLQWLSASEAEVAELHFHGDAPKEFVILSKKLQERGWKVGDLCQAVLKYCEVMEKAVDGERTLESETFFGWLQEYA